MPMPELFWGVDGRTHRLGPDGQALCRTQIDNSRDPVQRAVSGCSVCDIKLRDRDVLQGFRQRAADQAAAAGYDPGAAPDRSRRPTAGGSRYLPIALVALAALLIWTLVR
jgi:hypothetical protein